MVLLGMLLVLVLVLAHSLVDGGWMWATLDVQYVSDCSGCMCAVFLLCAAV